MAHFILVHGAWHGAWCWYKVRPLLQAAGHTVDVFDLPSNGIDRTPPGQVTFQDYVDRVVAAIDAAPEPAILVGHSLGGRSISQAAEARPDRVAWLVYLTAIMVRDGEASCFQQSDNAPIFGAIVQAPDGASMSVRPDLLKEIFYGGCSVEDIALANACLVPQSTGAAGVPLSLSAGNYGRIPRAYIECTRDNAIPIAIQRRMMDAQPPKRVISMDTDHSPFFSAALDLARHLDSLA